MVQLRIPLALLALTIYSAPAFASKKDEQQIRYLYATLAAGLRTRDLKLIDSTETSNFQEKAGRATLSKEEVDKQILGEFAVTKHVNKCSIEVTSISITRSTAIGKTKFEMIIVTAPESKTDPKSGHLVSIVGTTVEKIVKTKKGWLFQSSADVSSHMTVDGKPLKPRKPS